MSHRSTSLLLAVYESVKTRATPPATGGSPVTWPYVVDALASLQPDAGWTDSTARKAYRNVRNLAPAERQSLIEGVREPYEDVVVSVMDAGVPHTAEGLAGAPDDSSAQEAAPRNEDWLLRMAPIKQSELNEGAFSGEARDSLMEAMVNVIIQGQEIHRNLEWRKPVFTWDVPDDKPIGLVFLSDTHIGNSGVDYLRLREDMNLIRDTEGLFATHLGDWTDNFNPKVIPQGMLSTSVHPADQWELAEWFVRTQLGGSQKMPAAIVGNHDDFSSVAGLSECKQMLRSLGIRSLGPGGRVWVRLASEVYKIEIRHHYNFNSSLNESNSQRRLLELTMGADAVWFGHLHVPTHHYVHRGEIDAHLGRSGAYKIFDYWAEQKGFKHGPDTPAPDMGMVIMMPGEHRTLGFRNFRHGLHTLAYLRNEGSIPW